jgi:hypothetical protein
VSARPHRRRRIDLVFPLPGHIVWRGSGRRAALDPRRPHLRGEQEFIRFPEPPADFADLVVPFVPGSVPIVNVSEAGAFVTLVSDKLGWLGPLSVSVSRKQRITKVVTFG